ncbi:MAG: hypothetical protein ACFFEF_01975 [Candidatus Thorarchaeota archaeon]
MGSEGIFDLARKEIEADDKIREKVLPLVRLAVRKCSESIKHSHRKQYDIARAAVKESQNLIEEARKEMEPSEYLGKSRILDTAYQELAEATNLLSILEQGSLTPLDAFNIPSRPFLTGLADTIGELRRATLERLREGLTDDARGLLKLMEEIFEELNSFDFPNSLVPDLRRKCDVARGIIERTRGDVTAAVRQDRLINEIGRFEERLKRE